ncbi:ParA family protein, partial [Roseburia sp. 1XD42-69]
DKGGKVAAAYEQFGKEVAELGEKQRKQNRADRIR